MSLTLKQLKIFRAIALHDSLTSAAQALFLTKPALSMALQELEKQLEQPLFDRVNNRLHLNHQGQRLLPLADELLQRAGEIEQSFRQDGSQGGRLNIGASNTIGDYLLPTLLGDFMTQYPDCRPSICIANTELLAQRLSRFELDIILVEGSLNDPCLLRYPWLNDEMLLLAAVDHPLTVLYRQKGYLEVTDLMHQSWLLREPGSGAREHFDRTLAAYLGDWTLRLESPRNEVILGGCRAGLGLAYISSFVAGASVRAGTLCALPLALETRRPLSLVLQKEKYEGTLLRSFRQFCHDWIASEHGQALIECNRE